MLGPDVNGTWHMFAAHMTDHCGLTSWKTNSQVVHATAARPEGPYTRREVVIPRFSHNPTVRELPGGSGYALYAIGCGGTTVPPLTNCSGGHTVGSSCGTGACPSDGCNSPHWTGMWTSTSLWGPWVSQGEVTIQATPGVKSDTWTTNPAPWFLANGSVLWMYRQGAQSWPNQTATSERLGVGVTAGWQDTAIVDRTPAAPILPYAIEDQYAWVDPKGNYHALVHKGPGGMASHLFSRDGLQWGVSASAPYDTEVALTDGSVRKYGKRARPQLVVSREGRPRYLSTGTDVGESPHTDHICTVVQPVAGS